MKRRFQFGYAAVLVVGLCSTADAQADQAFTPRPTVARALDVIEPYPAKVAVGTKVAFTRKPTRSAEKMVHDGIQVRVFALDAHTTEPRPLTTIEGCNVYVSAVYPLPETADRKIAFQKIDGAWLDLSNSRNSIRNAHYYLVFEKSGPEAPLFKLRSADAHAYFATGFTLEVLDDGTTDIAAVRREYESRRLSLGQLYDEIDHPTSNVPCYRYVQYAGAPDGVELAGATLVDCTLATESTQEDPSS